MCHLNYKEEGKCLVLFVFFFLAHQYDELSHIPNHIQVVSKSAVLCVCVESTDPDQETKPTERGCTVLKSWSLQHCLKQELAWGVQRDACKMMFVAALQAGGSRLLCAAGVLPVTLIAGTTSH